MLCRNGSELRITSLVTLDVERQKERASLDIRELRSTFEFVHHRSIRTVAFRFCNQRALQELQNWFDKPLSSLTSPLVGWTSEIWFLNNHLRLRQLILNANPFTGYCVCL